MRLQAWGAESGIEVTALRRLYELSPQEAFRIVAKDITSGSTRFAGFAAREIKSQEMPEADTTFSRWLRTGELGALPLIGRFATEKLAIQMRERYLAQSWPCLEEVSFITYFVRTLPPSGKGSAGELLRRALADREKRGCHHSLLRQVGQIIWKPVLETQAIVSLDDPDPETVASAVYALSTNGGPSVEPFLWKRLEKWSEQWRGRTLEFDVHPITGGLPNQESLLGPALFGGIPSAKAWVMDEPRWHRLSNLCIDEQCRKQWAQAPVSTVRTIDVSNGGGMYPAAFRVNGYQTSTFEALKDKLKHFPQGTTFRWCPQTFNPFDDFSPGQREEMYRELIPFVTALSMTIEPYAEAKCLSGQN